MSPTTKPGPSAAIAHERARIAAYSRNGQPDHPNVTEARRNLAAINIEEHIARVLAAAPPLTVEQRCRIGALLRTGGVK